MAKGKLTDIQLRAYLSNPPAQRVEVKDGTVEGLTVRVGPRSRPTWVFRFRLRGAGGVTDRGTPINGAKYHRVSIGAYPEVSVTEARKKAAAYLDDVKAGRNPLDEFEERAVARGDTVGQLVEDYLAHAEATMRSWRNAKWTLNRHLVPAWRDKLVGTITEREARKLVDEVKKGDPDPETGKIVARNGAAGEVRKWGGMLFAWAKDHGRAKANPFAAVPVPKLDKRQRFLTMEEARAVWTAAGSLTAPWGAAIRLLMLTGCREMEVCAAQWPWFNSAAAELIVPPEHYKSGRHFLVCLPRAAIDILEAQPRRNAGDFIFSTTNGEKAIAGIPRKTLDVLHDLAEKELGRPMPRFALHDLRRTARTHLARLGVDDVVAELVLGHALKGLQASYNIYGFAEEKRRALALWADELVPTEKGQSGPALNARDIVVAIKAGTLSDEMLDGLTEVLAADIAEGRLAPELMYAMAAAVSESATG